ncbi:unnamed protein product [Arabis nemorensis]|uniref:SKP1 component POZ domain-containing protein n=1 Tax=Arabis nemorensis TaxID=586526 RepID=A0A565BIZ7_9BRAS|nr:unnamed protein product [Arabis nemorensis]
MSNTKKIALKSSDGEIFKIEETVALQSQLIANMVKDGCVDKVISLDKITGETLTKVIEYCKKHVDGGGSKEELKTWDAEFMKNIINPILLKLLNS